MQKIKFVNGRFLLKENKRYFIHRGDCCVENGVIAGFDIDNFNQEVTCQLNGKLVIPAFYNTHIHLGESLYKDIEGEWTLDRYLAYTENFNACRSREERASLWLESGKYTINEAADNGTGFICAARCSGLSSAAGLKALSGYPVMNSVKLEEYLKNGLEGFIRYKSEVQDDDNKVGVFLHSIYGNTKEGLMLAKTCMENGGEFVTTHLSETKETKEAEYNLYKRSPVETLIDFGLLGKKTILVHCGLLNKYELGLVKEHNASVSICPISNSFLGTKVPDLELFENLGVEWYVATDGVATGRSFSLLKQAQFIKRIYQKVSYERLYESFTNRPCGKFSINNSRGLLEIGAAADLQVIDCDLMIKEDKIVEWLIETQPKAIGVYVNGKLVTKFNDIEYPSLR